MSQAAKVPQKDGRRRLARIAGCWMVGKQLSNGRKRMAERAGHTDLGRVGESAEPGFHDVGGGISEEGAFEDEDGAVRRGTDIGLAKQFYQTVACCLLTARAA